MVKFYEDEIKPVTTHGDYPENLYYAEKFCYTWQEKNPESRIKIDMIKTVNINYQYVMFSYLIPDELELGKFATPVSLNQSTAECKKELKFNFSAYQDMDKEIERRISRLNSPRINDCD